MRDFTAGFDFGTSTSAVGDHEKATVRVLPIGDRSLWMPSLAAHRDGRWFYGEAADGMLEEIRSIKNRITNNEQTVEIEGVGAVPVDDVIAGILAEAIERSAKAGQDLRGKRVRMGCPALWNRAQRERLAAAARAAGLDVTIADLIEEPVAAGVAWVSDERLHHDRRHEGRALVLDIGGGTVDVAVLEIEQGENQPRINVRASRGHLGAGDMLDQRIAQHLTDAWIARGVDAETLRTKEIGRAARLAKEALTFTEVHPVSDVVIDGTTLPSLDLDRGELELLFGEQLNGIVEQVELCLRQSMLFGERPITSVNAKQMSMPELAESINLVLLTGGMSVMPAVVSRITAEFPNATIFKAEEANGDPDVVGAMTQVVRGLSTSDAFDSLNLSMPGFDFVLQWEDRSGVVREVTLYEAFTSLAPEWKVLGEYALGARKRVSLPNARPGWGSLRLRAVDGSEVPIIINGEDQGTSVLVPVDPYRGVELEVRQDRVIYRPGQMPTVAFGVRGFPLTSRAAEHPAAEHPAAEHRALVMSTSSVGLWSAGGFAAEKNKPGYADN